MLNRVLDGLRLSFIYIVALVLPLAGAIIAAIRYAEGDRDEATKVAAAALLGISVYALLFA